MLNKEELERYIGTEDLTLVEAMQKIGFNAKGIIYIVNEQGGLVISLTDGVIRGGYRQEVLRETYHR